MNYKKIGFLLVLSWCFFMLTCKRSGKVDPTTMDATNENGINAVIEIPAGSNHKIEYNKSTRQFENDQIDGKDRIIDFLPYPGNYGFIPGTYMDPEKGGDGDAVDVLVLAERMEMGSALEVIPIAALLLKDGEELDTKIIAVPADSTKRIIQATNFQDFAIKYSSAQNIIEQWFANYKGLGKIELIGWRNEHVAEGEVKKWIKD